MMSKQNKIEILSFIKVAVPAVLTQLAQMSMNVTDTIMAGRYGTEALAGISIGVSILNPIVKLALGIFLAYNPLVARNNGEKNQKAIADAVQQGLWLCGVLSIPCIVLLWNTESLLLWLGIQRAIVPVTAAYLQSLCWGLFPLFVFTLLRFVNDGLFKSQVVMKVIFIAIPLNAALNYILMYGKFGLPEMGAVGTGYATSIVWLIMAVVLSLFTFKRKNYAFVEHFNLFRSINFAAWLSIFKVGVPIALSFSIEVGLLALIGIMVGTMPVSVISGHQVAINITAMLFMIPAGIAVATTARVSFGLGRASLSRVSRTMEISFLLTFCCSLITLAVMLVVPQMLAAIYTNDTAVIEVALTLIVFSALVQLPNGIKTNAAAVLRGFNDTKVPMYFVAVSYLGVGVVSAFILAIVFRMGASGLWAGLIAAHICAAILMTGRLSWWRKRQLVECHN